MSRQTASAHIWEHTRGLNARLRSGLVELGASLVGDGSDAHQSGIVCFRLPSGHARERELLNWLAENHIYVSLRYVSGIGGIRVSPHVDNTTEDIDQLLAVTRSYCASR